MEISLIFRWFRTVLRDRKYYWFLATLALAADGFLTQLIIRFIPYTEIDWETYMVQARLFALGERNYTKIEGPTGPIVYPAGHLHLHRFLSNFEHNNGDRFLLQQIYGVLYLASLVASMALYFRMGAPNWTILFLPVSKRLHSIFVLRLFNDCWTTFLMQCSILAFSWSQDLLAVVLFSLALSIKMSILLYLPAILLLLVYRKGLISTVAYLFAAAAIQAALASEFLVNYPREYLIRSFDFSRSFLYKWTVNWKFMDESTFLSRQVATSLLITHLTVLLAFAAWKWCRRDGGPLRVGIRTILNPSTPVDVSAWDAKDTIALFFTCNLIGIACARSLHYQFYAWYAYQVPALAWKARLPLVLQIILLGAIEYGWNVYPATAFSSLVLLASHIVLVGVLFVR